MIGFLSPQIPLLRLFPPSTFATAVVRDQRIEEATLAPEVGTKEPVYATMKQMTQLSYDDHKYIYSYNTAILSI